MVYLRSSLSALLVLTTSATALAAPTLQTDTPILTGLHDVSNLASANNSYEAYFGNSDGHSLYLNSTTFVPGVNWNANINLTLPTAGLSYSGSNQTPFYGFYTFGTEIKDGDFYYLHDMAAAVGAINASAPDGIYNFSIKFNGGTTASSNSVLGSLNYQIEIFDKLNAKLVASCAPNHAGVGGTSALNYSVTNNMTGRTFVTSTWSDATLSDGSTSISGAGSGNDWFGKQIASGGTLTQTDSTLTVGAGNAPGVYTGDGSIYGGLYNPDFYQFSSTASLTVTTPEPTLLAVVPAAIMLLGRRRARINGSPMRCVAVGPC